jgi:hypothetical protein
MFRKKQTPPPSGRVVRRQQSAPVFSYHANRSPVQGVQRGRGMRQDESGSKRRRVFKLPKPSGQWVSYAPTALAGIVLAFCLIYCSTLSTKPQVQAVGVGATGLARGIDSYEADLFYLFDKSILNRSKLLIDTEAIAREIQAEFPQLGAVAVVVPLVGRRPVVRVRPATPALMLGTLEGVMVVDENGRIMAEARDLESSVKDKLPTVQDESGLSLEKGKYAFPRETVAFIQEVTAQLDAQRLSVQAMTLPPIPNELHIRLENTPYYVKFDMRGKGRVQAGTLVATKKKLDGGKQTPREYIDVRIPGKAYYK